MIFGHKYTSEVLLKSSFNVTCEACGAKHVVEVTDKGEGAAGSIYFLNEQGAKETSLSKAGEQALKNINETVGLLKCPKCGLRNKDNKAAFWRKSVLQVLGIGIFIALIGGLVYLIKQDKMALYIFSGVTVFGMYITYITIEKRWNTIDARVEFKETLD